MDTFSGAPLSPSGCSRRFVVGVNRQLPAVPLAVAWLGAGCNRCNRCGQIAVVLLVVVVVVVVVGVVAVEPS